MRQAGIIGFPLILLCLGIAFGGDFSTLNASIAAPARYLYTMACDGILPRCLGKLHPQWKTPVRAILLLGVVMILLVSTNSINYIASLSLFSTLIYYIIGMAAAYGLRKRYPRLERPYRAPAIKILAPLNIIIYILMITQLDSKAILSGIIWCAIGVIIFVISYEEQPPLDTSEILFNSASSRAPTTAGTSKNGPGISSLGDHRHYCCVNYYHSQPHFIIIIYRILKKTTTYVYTNLSCRHQRS